MSSIFDEYEHERLQSVRHNPTDMEQFKNFQKTMAERTKVTNHEQRKTMLMRRLEQWDAMTVGRWHKSRLKTLDTDIAKKVLAMIQQSSTAQSFYLQSVDAHRGMEVAHAIIRRYVGSGLVAPSRVVFTSEDELLGFAHSGFTGRDQLRRMMHEKNNVYIVDNCGSRPEYTEHRDMPVLEEFLSHAYAENKMLIYIGRVSLAGYSEVYSASGKSRLFDLFQDTNLVLSTEEDIPSEPKAPQSTVDFGLFEG